MIYYKIICWTECPFCLRAKMELIKRKINFEYCSVPMIIEIDTLTGQEKFIGGYTDLIEYFKESLVESQVPNVNGNG